MDAEGLFRVVGSRVEPTEAAVGPWDPGVVHGAAVAALFAGRLAPADATLARLTLDFLAPVPHRALELEVSERSGGSRVQRQEAVLTCDGRPVATARSLLVRKGELDLPEQALDLDTPFDPAAAPPLVEPNRAAAAMVGHESFDSRCLILEWLKVEGDRRVHQWISLAVPVVVGTELRGVEIAAVAADYAQSAVNKRLRLDQWSFRNAEQTLHLAREPVGRWVGARCESVLEPVGCGFNSADLFDEAGRVGRSSAAVVLEPRQPGATSGGSSSRPHGAPAARAARSAR